MCHVLIIEDEPLISMMIQDLLEGEGASSFDIADTQAAAIEAALARRPDLITSDVKLVEGTGPAAVETIHLRIGDVPVIFISGTPEDCRPCSPPGIILSKPFQNSVLAAAFHQMV